MASFSAALLFFALLPFAADAIEDTEALVQVSAEAGVAAARAQALSRSVAGRAMAVSSSAAAWKNPFNEVFKFNCTEHPKLCEPPFNCHTFTTQEFQTNQMRGLAPEGHANLRSWCTAPNYEEYMHMCLVKKDLVAAAKLQYQWSVDRHEKEGVDEMDGSYCFIEGHCSNQAVTAETTLDEADRMCDDRFGNEWREVGKTSWNFQQHVNPKGTDPKTGFHDPKITQIFLKAACAMGNYHCDVMYCKETYCKMPYFVKKYGHLLPRVPGHLIQSRTKV